MVSGANESSYAGVWLIVGAVLVVASLFVGFQAHHITDGQGNTMTCGSALSHPSDGYLSFTASAETQFAPEFAVSSCHGDFDGALAGFILLLLAGIVCWVVAGFRFLGSDLL